MRLRCADQEGEEDQVPAHSESGWIPGCGACLNPSWQRLGKLVCKVGVTPDPQKDKMLGLKDQ